MFQIDVEFIHPDIARTICFTPVLFNGLKKVIKREGISFNQIVLQCYKNTRDEDFAARESLPKESEDK